MNTLAQVMETDPNSWVALLREFGPWGSFVVAASVVFVRILYWLRPQAERLVACHVDFVTKMATTQEEIVGTQRQILTVQQQILEIAKSEK